MLELLACLKLHLHPMWLPSTTRPFLGGIFWILIFRKDLWIGTARPIGTNCAIGFFFKAAQAFFELALLLRYLASQHRIHLFV